MHAKQSPPGAGLGGSGHAESAALRWPAAWQRPRTPQRQHQRCTGRLSQPPCPQAPSAGQATINVWVPLGSTLVPIHAYCGCWITPYMPRCRRQSQITSR